MQQIHSQMQTNILTSLCICRYSCGKYFIKLEKNTHILIFQYLTFYILHSTFITCILRTLEDNTLDINLLDCFHYPRLPKSKFVNQYIFMGFPGGSAVKKIHLPMQETWVWSLDQEDPLEREMATSSSISAWEIPWTEEPNGYSPWDCKRIWHNLATWQQHIYEASILMRRFTNHLKSPFQHLLLNALSLS